METQKAKLGKEDAEAPDLAIRVRILCESDLIFFIFL